MIEVVDTSGIRAAYAARRARDRMHVAGRLRSCPFDAVVSRVPVSGRILDVGCGHGVLSLLLASGSGKRSVLGVDVDRDKLTVARDAATRAGLGNVDFEAVTAGTVPVEEFDAICVVDVLYLLGRDSAELLLAGLAAAVAPGGVLLVKEIAVRPAWKYQLARVQELVATRVVRITEGTTVEFVPPDDVSALLAAAGLAVEHVPLAKGRLHPHHLVVGRRSSNA